GLSVLKGEIVDGTVMSRKALISFLQQQVEEAKTQGVLFSLHMKATMMKVSDPIIFGHAVRVFFAPVFEKYGTLLEKAGGDPNNGLGDIIAAAESLDETDRKAVLEAIESCIANGPDLAMVNSDKGITNL